MLSSHPKSLRCDIEKGFITCFATLTAACSFGVGVWVYSLVSSPFAYTYECLCVFDKKKKKTKIVSVVKMSHIGNVWYWEGVHHLHRDTNGRMQFLCCHVSVLSCLIPLPLYNLFLCLLNKKERKKKTLSVVKSSHIDNVWYWKRVYRMLRETNCSLKFWCWHARAFPCLTHLPRYNVCNK